MSGKPVDLEWLDSFSSPMSYEEAMTIILGKKNEVSENEKYWRMPSQHELQVILQNHLPGSGLRQTRYMCRSSRLDGRITAVCSDGKVVLVDPKTRLHLCLVR